MKKEIDTYKLDSLFNVFKRAMLWAWYLSGATIGALLWFHPIQESNIQTFAFSGIFILYTLMSVCIAKLEAIRIELK